MNLPLHSDLSYLTRLLRDQFLVLVSDVYSSIQTHRFNFTWYVFVESNRNNPNHLSLEQETLPESTLGELESQCVVGLPDPSPALLSLLHSHWQFECFAPKWSLEKELRYWCFEVENIQIDCPWSRNFQKLLQFYSFCSTKKTVIANESRVFIQEYRHVI